MMRGAAILIGVLVAWPAFAEPVVAIRMNGRADNRLNIAVLGDGYAAADMNRFASDADLFMNHLFSTQPFKEYAAYFNVYRVDIVSTDSGVDHPEWQQMKDTVLGTSYFCGSVQRYICFDRAAVDGVLARSTLPADLDLVLVLVNDREYGGSGGRYAVAAAGSGDVETMVHEAGHTFGLLADEYTDGSQNNCLGTQEPAYANATRQTQRDQIKWRHWIDDATPIPTTTLAPALPGLYPGSHHCISGLYRPTNESKMKWPGKPFEQVNTEQLVRRFYNFVSPIDRVTPQIAEQRVRRGESAAFFVDRPRPATHDLEVEWTLDGSAIGDAASLILDTSSIAAGRHVLRVTVRDPTPLVRLDPTEALLERFEWTIEITP